MKVSKCKLIVIDGLDGSGKATQTKILCDRLRESGFKARTLTFPDYESDTSALVKMYLGGAMGENADDVNAYAASSFYAVDRVASYLSKWKQDYESLDYIIADRYTTSNIIHQMSKVEPDERAKFIDWLYDFEYNRLCIPKPDMVIFLDVDPGISQKLIFSRYNGDETKKDIHEKDFRYLMKCRESAVYATGHLGWTVIKCSDENGMKPVETISEMIFQEIKEK